VREVPPRWAATELGGVCKIVRGITFPASAKISQEAEGYVCCLRTSNVQDAVDWNDIYFVPRQFVKREDQFVQPGDILMSMANSYELVGKVAIATKLPMQSAFGAFLSVIRPLPGIDGKFLYYLLKTPYVQSALRSGSSQTVNIANISVKTVSAIRVPIAPHNEQRRIAEKLDDVLSRVRACRERLERVPEILKRFREAVIEAAVSGRLTQDWRERINADHSKTGAELATLSKLDHQVVGAGRAAALSTPDGVEQLREIPSTWGWISAAHIVEPGAEIVYGIVQPGPKLASGVPYVRGMDIVDGNILVHQLLRTSEAIAKRYERASLKGGDILLGIIRATKVAIVPDTLAGANITQGTARLRPSRYIRTKYLALVLEAPLTQDWLHDCYRGIDMPGLNLADVRRTPIPLPPLEEQDEIIRRAGGLLRRSERLDASSRSAIKTAGKLVPSLLRKAFRGKLVRQDPREEPAAEMLERMPATNRRGRSGTKAGRVTVSMSAPESRQAPLARKRRTA